MALVFAPIDSFIEWVTIGILLFIALVFWYQVIEQDLQVWKQWYRTVKKRVDYRWYPSIQLLPNVQMVAQRFHTCTSYTILLSFPLCGVLMIEWERKRVTVKG